MFICHDLFQRNTVCEELDISDNYVEGDGASALAEMMKENMFIVSLVCKYLENLVTREKISYNVTCQRGGSPPRHWSQPVSGTESIIYSFQPTGLTPNMTLNGSKT